MKLLRFLARIGLIKILKSDIKKTGTKEDYNFLSYAYVNGLYHSRLEVIKGLIKLDNQKIVPILEKAINDKIPVISILAIEALVGYSNPEILKIVENRLEFWDKESKKKKSQ